ncbi:MAG: cation-translocating P-type ATPase [Ruminococcaceae bacterium]|nr:cation-translocating P-type ATPase [Oscillospiraceae bacterium]
MVYYREPKEKVLAEFSVDENGLGTKTVEERQEKYGKNKLAEGKKDSLLKKFFSQFADPMILVLLAAAVLSGVTAVIENESFVDVFIILFVVVLNAVLSVIQESKAEQAIEALKTMAASTSKVIRNSVLTVVKSEDLVCGDIICLEAGDAVPADARIIECASMKVEESALTGESVPVIKTDEALEGDGEVSLGDRKNMLYMGSTVVYGRGKAVVVGTGMSTEMGKIADVITQSQNEQTPLQKKLAELSKILTWLVLGICVVMFIIGAMRGDPIIDSFMLAISLAVAAIPEGLVAVVTIVLSMGVTKMSARNAIIRKMTAVETLGCTQVICSDKTGTLTQNKMTVVESTGADKELLCRAMSLCSDAELDIEKQDAVGEPTECALVNFAFKNGYDKNNLKTDWPRVGEAPFDSMRKRMSTVHSNNGGYVQYTKGAPDEILSHCTHVLTENGVEELDQLKKNRIMDENKSMADKALRVLAAAYRSYSEIPQSFDSEALEEKMIFIGLCGMIDPIRPEVKDAVETCKGAGISTVMITGDHIDTAVAIGRELGIITSADQAIMGSQLDSMSEEELDKVITDYRVFARVQPEHKVKIVSAWKRKGAVTAMTGDGVNDAPSIKVADIGIGMGITGTDVTKNVADMILADDNFATIVSAVGEGRRIYQNIRKSIQFLLSSNLSEVIGIFFATLCGFTLLKPVHMLWINLITDSIPALALGMEEGESDAMTQKPRDPKKGIFSDGVGGDIAYQGLFVAILTLAAYFVGHYIESGVWEIANSNDGMTMAFLTMSMAEIFQSFNMRSRDKSLFSIRKQNWFLIGGAVLAFVLTAAVVYIPFFREVFGFTAISLTEYAVALALAFLIIPLVEIVKLVKRIINKRKAK